MKPNGDWEPIDECRAAWRPRVDLPHTLFEIMLRQHMAHGFRFDGMDRAALDGAAAVAAIAESVERIAALPGRPDSSFLAAHFQRDKHMAQDLRSALRAPGDAAPVPARTAWATAAFMAAAEPLLPKNLWCSHGKLYAAIPTAIDDAREPVGYHFASALTAYQRLQCFNAALPAMAQAFVKTDRHGLAAVAAHVFSRNHATMRALRDSAAQEWQETLRQPGIIPLRPRAP